MEEARANVDVDKHERGFRKIAWAFLKVLYLAWLFGKTSLNLILIPLFKTYFTFFLYPLACRHEWCSEYRK